MKPPHPRFVLFFAALVLSAGSALIFLDPLLAAVTGFDVAALVFLASTVPLWRDASPAEMRGAAARDDGGRSLLLFLSALVALVVLIALGLLVSGRGGLGAPDLVLAAASLALAWAFVNTVYTFHYAHLYYDAAPEGGDRLGLRFPETKLPAFSDFGYFAFTIGMTFQTSDVAIVSATMRQVVTIHALLAFVFNIGVLALTVNVLAGVF